MVAVRGQERGFLLISVAIGLVLVSVIVLLLGETGSHDMALRERQHEHRSLEYAAEAGIAHARWTLASNDTCTGYNDVATTPFGAYSYVAQVDPDSGSPVTLVSTATGGDGQTVSLSHHDFAMYEPTTSVVLQPGAEGKDSFLEGDPGHQDHNKANDKELRTDSETGKQYRSLIEFDLSSLPSGIKIVSATLEVYLEASTGSPDTVYVHSVTADWDESEVTWLQRKTFRNWSSAGGDYSAVALSSFVADSVGWKSADITSLADQWQKVPASNHGVILRSDDASGNNQKTYTSSDDADASRHPRLTVVYACECGAVCSTLGDALLPVAHWTLDDGSGSTAVDSAGGHDGTLTSGPTWTSDGVRDGALLFDGIDDHIVVPHDDSLSITEALSISAWARVDSAFLGTNRIISKERPGMNDNFWLSVQGDQLWMGIGGEFFSPGIALPSNEWFHVVGMYDSVAGEVRIYLNGFEALAQATSTTLTPNTDELIIGANWESGKFFDGALDDVRIYDRVLGESEIIDQAYAPTYCDAEYAPDNRQSTFSSAGASYGFGRGITYFPAGRTLGGTVAPLPGAWIAVGDDSDRLVLTSTAGAIIDDTFATDIKGYQGVAYLEAGQHAGQLVAVSGTSLYLIDPKADPVTSYTTHDLSALAASAMGITFVDGGTYNKHVAVIDDVNREIYILDQNLNEAQTINLGAISGSVSDIAHVRGTDQFLVMNRGNDQVVMIDAFETVGLSYDVAKLGYANPDAVAIHPLTCQHLVSDDIADEYAYLNVGGYIEAHEPWSATSSDTWQVVDLSAFGVPPGAVAEVAIVNASTGAQRLGGVRAYGSTLNRYLQLHEAESGGIDVVTMHVQADASGRIEHYSDQASEVSFVLLGYWTKGTYVEDIQLFKSGVNGTWQNHAMAAYGVPPGAVVDLAILNLSTNTEFQAGARTSGSTEQRRFDVHEAESGGRDMFNLSTLAGSDAGATIEVAAEHSGSIDFYLTGYWSDPPGTYSEAFTELSGNPASSGVWHDKDLSGDGLPARAVAQVVMANGQDSAAGQLGVRRKGSGEARVFDLQEAESGGYDLGTMHVDSDANSVIQWYDENIGNDHRFYLTGWWD